MKMMRLISHHFHLRSIGGHDIMILDSRMVKLLNTQINGEYVSYFLYNSMANWFGEKDLSGWEKLFREYAIEEINHADKLTQHVLKNNGHVSTPLDFNPDDIQTTWKSIDEILKAALQHEMKVSMIYHELKDAAISLKDYTTSHALDWFINEQIEEESKIRDLIAEFEVGSDNCVVTVMNRMIGDCNGDSKLS